MPRTFSLLFVLLTISLSTPAYAQVDVTVSVTQISGQYVYDYTVENLFLDESIDTFSISGIAGILDASGPDDWPPFVFGDEFGVLADWTTFLPSSFIGPGTSLSGFQLTSSFGPGSVDYDGFTSDFNSFSGVTSGPVAVVPEPESFGLAIAGFLLILTCAIAFQRRNRYQVD